MAPWTKDKQNAYYSKYYEENREKLLEYARNYRSVNSESLFSTRLERKYGITLDERDKLLASQGGVCAICKIGTPPTKKGWCVDHCHETKAVRGVLCAPCNLLLGHAKDNPEILTAAVSYLRQSQKVH